MPFFFRCEVSSQLVFIYLVKYTVCLVKAICASVFLAGGGTYKVKTFSDIEKLKEFITSRPVLQEMLKFVRKFSGK